jgi:type II secretory pathway pseudopilin PulG
VSRWRDDERGETLLELVITLLIMGTVIVALLAGIATAFSSSDINKKEIGVEVVLHSYAEAVMGATYNGCSVPTGITYTAPAGYGVSTPVVTGCYDGTSTTGGFTGNTDNGAVRLRLEAHSTDTVSTHHRSQTLEIVKASDYVRPS